MKKDKVESLLGFAVKAGKIIYGSDKILAAKTKYYLIFLCDTAAENTRKRVLSVAEDKSVPVISPKTELQYLVARTNCKALAITDMQMAEAMVNMLGENYRLINAEVR